MTTITEGSQAFYVGENELNPDAEIGYSYSEDGDIVIDHTVVSESLQGQGIASELVKQVVEKARQDGRKIVPQCSYAKKKLEGTPDYQDVLKQ